jgi:hypothetical protein
MGPALSASAISVRNRALSIPNVHALRIGIASETIKETSLQITIVLDVTLEGNPIRKLCNIMCQHSEAESAQPPQVFLFCEKQIKGSKKICKIEEDKRD